MTAVTVAALALGPAQRLVAPRVLDASTSRWTDQHAAAVAVRVEGRGGGRFDAATGVSLGAGLVLANRHAVDQRVLTVGACRGTPLAVRDVAVSDGYDAALLVVDGSSPPAAGLAEDDPSPGTRLAMPGYRPTGEPVVATALVDSYFDAAYLGQRGTVMRFTPPPAPGQSGSPLLDPEGRVTALVYAVEGASGFGLAIPASSLRVALAEMVIDHLPLVAQALAEPFSLAPAPPTAAGLLAVLGAAGSGPTPPATCP